MVKIVPKCSECDEFAKFVESNGGPHRYYCINPLATAGVGSRKISSCERGNTEIKTKTSPKWCPKRAL